MSAIPKWASRPILRFEEYIHDGSRLLHLCMRGLSEVTKLPALYKILDGLPGAEGWAKEADALSDDVAFAKREIENEFPTLHEHTLVGLWGALDALILDLAEAWLGNQPECLELDAFRKVRVPVAEYVRLAESERIRYIVRELYRSLNADLKMGVGKFEAILEALKLGGPVDDVVRRDLLELSQVRNVFVHRGRVVDDRFKEACPWSSFAVGDRLTVNHALYLRYFRAVHTYVFGILSRINVHFGGDPLREEDGEAETPPN